MNEAQLWRVLPRCLGLRHLPQTEHCLHRAFQVCRPLVSAPRALPEGVRAKDASGANGGQFWLPQLTLVDPAIAGATADTERTGSLPDPPRNAPSSGCALTPCASSPPLRRRAGRSARGISAGADRARAAREFWLLWLSRFPLMWITSGCAVNSRRDPWIVDIWLGSLPLLFDGTPAPRQTPKLKK